MIEIVQPSCATASAPELLAFAQTKARFMGAETVPGLWIARELGVTQAFVDALVIYRDTAQRRAEQAELELKAAWGAV